MSINPNGSALRALSILDRESIAHAIDDGLARGLSSLEIADAVLEPISDPQVAKVLTHPVRVRTIALLRHGPTSPSQAATQLQVGLGTVAYHFRVLLHAGVVELCDTAQRRGAVEHYYRLVDHTE